MKRLHPSALSWTSRQPTPQSIESPSTPPPIINLESLLCNTSLDNAESIFVRRFVQTSVLPDKLSQIKDIALWLTRNYEKEIYKQLIMSSALKCNYIYVNFDSFEPEIWREILQSTHSLKNIELSGVLTPLHVQVITSEMNWSTMESLTLSCCFFDNAASIECFEKFLRTTASLKHFHLYDCTLVGGNHVQVLPIIDALKSLENLEQISLSPDPEDTDGLTDVHLPILMEVLSNNPNLHTLDISANQFNDLSVLGPVLLKHPSLKDFKLRSSSSNAVFSLLQLLLFTNAPALTKLDIRWIEYVHGIEAPAIVNLYCILLAQVVRSNHTLKKLSFSHFTAPGQNVSRLLILLEYISRNKNLEHLVLDYSDLDDGIFEAWLRSLWKENFTLLAIDDDEAFPLPNPLRRELIQKFVDRNSKLHLKFHDSFVAGAITGIAASVTHTVLPEEVRWEIAEFVKTGNPSENHSSHLLSAVNKTSYNAAVFSRSLEHARTALQHIRTGNFKELLRLYKGGLYDMLTNEHVQSLHDALCSNRVHIGTQCALLMLNSMNEAAARSRGSAAQEASAFATKNEGLLHLILAHFLQLIGDALASGDILKAQLVISAYGDARVFSAQEWKLVIDKITGLFPTQEEAFSILWGTVENYIDYEADPEWFIPYAIKNWKARIQQQYAEHAIAALLANEFEAFDFWISAPEFSELLDDKQQEELWQLALSRTDLTRKNDLILPMST